MTPADLIAEADALDARGRACLDTGDADGAALAFQAANVRRAAAARMAASSAKRLPVHVKGRTFHSSMLTDEHRLAIAAGHPAPDNKLKRVAKAAGFTLAGLAKAVKGKGLPCSSALLTMAQAGTRPMPEATGEAIQELTRSEKYPEGYPASSWRQRS